MLKNLYKISFIIILLGFFNISHALTVSPAKLEITGDPGTVLSGEIQIFNEQDSTKTFFVSYENFEPKGETGAPHFVGAKEGLATWIETPDNITVNPAERTTIPYKITIPSDAKAGGYFSAIFFGNQPPKTDGISEVTIGGKIGVLVLLRVSGDIKEAGGLLDFGTIEEKRFFNSLPVTFEYRVNNLGADRIVPKGELKIKNMLWLNSAVLLANKNEGSILPSSARKFEVIWGEYNNNNPQNSQAEEKLGFFAMAGKQLKDFHFGLYTAKLNISWGETNQTAKDSFVFFVFPWQLLIIVLVILIIIGFIASKLIKKYNRWVIAQAKKSLNQ